MKPIIVWDNILTIGTKVFKTSGKPFKSGSKINTIRGITINPKTGYPAYTFHDDDSIVDARTCEQYKEYMIEIK
jgi:hypothetical protein